MSGDPRTVTITVRYDDIDEAMQALAAVHDDYCVAGNCRCGGADERLGALLDAEAGHE